MNQFRALRRLALLLLLTAPALPAAAQSAAYPSKPVRFIVGYQPGGGTDLILTLLTLEITSVKNMRLFLEVCEQLGYGPEKIRLVLNRADSSLGIRVADVEHSIGRRVDHTIVSDGRSVVYALNRGVPFFLSNREAQVSQDILRLASAVAGINPAGAAEPARKGAQKKSLFAWR